MAKVHTLPPNYSEADAELRRQLSEQLDQLRRDYERACEPIYRVLREIEGRYTPRIFVERDPDDPIPFVPSHLLD